MKRLILFSTVILLTADVGAADALATLDGTATARVTRLDAAKAHPYRDGFARDGDEIVCTVTTNAERISAIGKTYSSISLGSLPSKYLRTNSSG